MKSTVQKVFISLFFTIQLLAANAQSLSNEKISKAEAIFSSHFNVTSPGGAFAIIEKGEVVFKKTIGLANVEHQIPITDTTVFNIASNSKQFTTLLALLLEAEGKLSFQDDVRSYLPELNELPHKITIKQLTNHTHGLPNVDELAQLKEIGRMTHNEVEKMLYSINQFNFLPGNDFQYNNTGYVLLSEIIERVGGKSFQEQLKEKIFSKLGMNSTQADGDYNSVILNKAYSYSSTENGFRNNPVRISTMGSSGIYTSLNDMIIWTQNFMKTDNPFKQYLDKMQQATQLNSGKVIEYGMGLQFENYKGVDIVFHGGGTESYRSYLLHVPKYELSLLFLSNAGGVAGLDVIYSSLDVLLEEALTIQQKDNFDTEQLREYEGTYELIPGDYYTIFSANDSLYAQPYGTSEKMHLPQIDENVFIYPNLPYAKLIFYKDGFDLRFADFTYPAKRVTLPNTENLNLDIEKYVGVYTNKAHDSSYEVVLTDNALLIKHSEGTVRLHPHSAQSFYTINNSFGKIEFLFDEQANVIGFNLSRQNIAGLTFLK